jgi:pilus assembly protein Flp/PilA
VRALNPSSTPHPLAPPEIQGRSELRHVKLFKDQRGATAIEYGLIAALISIACMIAFRSLGLNLAVVFQTIADAMAGR